MPTAWAATAGRVVSKVDRAAWPAGRSRPSGPGPGERRASPCPRAACDRVCARRRGSPRRCGRPGCPSSETCAPCSDPWCLGGTMKLAWPRPLSSGPTDATTTCTSAMPPLVIQVLVPLSTHSSVASSYTGAGPHAADVGTGVRLGHAEGGQRHLLGRAEALGQPFTDLLRGPVSDRCRPRPGSCRRWPGRCRRRPRPSPPSPPGR